jgi:hypothetical protein
VVIGQDPLECDEFNPLHADCELHVVMNSEDRAIAAIANEYLMQTEKAVFGLVHPDTKLGPGALQIFYETAMAGFMCGIVGRDLGQVYRWCCAVDGLVSTLDDCSVFFRRDAGLAFDAAVFDSFHAYVPDLCLQAQAQGIKSMVPPADATHTGRRFFTDHDRHQSQWDTYLERLRRKWAGVVFATT